MSAAVRRPVRFAGYAALFNIPDGINDTIHPGAFALTLAERRARALGALPLYWQHDPDRQIGEIERIAEDARGLRVVARLDDRASRAARALQAHAVSGLSFGYRARSFRRKEGGRILTRIDLIEVSLVTHPLQHGARVHLVA